MVRVLEWWESSQSGRNVVRDVVRVLEWWESSQKCGESVRDVVSVLEQCQSSQSGGEGVRMRDRVLEIGERVLECEEQGIRSSVGSRESVRVVGKQLEMW